MIVDNRCPTKQGRTSPPARPRRRPGEDLLCVGSCTGLLLIVTLIPTS
jgi:hypothetical protein